MQLRLVNRAGLLQREIDDYLTAQNVQLGQFFAHWSIGSHISEDPSEEVIIYLATKIDVENAIGYHDATSKGVPFGVVDVNLAERLGEDWTVTASHEALELLGDQLVNDFCLGPHPTERRYVFHWREMCDCVQGDTYPIGNVIMSNFALPHYLTQGEEEGRDTNYLGLPLRSFGCRPGGYLGFFDPKVNDHVTWSPDARGAQRLAIKETAFGRRRLRRLFHP